jgi:hypothetical protein
MREPSSLELDLFSDTDMPVLAPSVEALPEVPTLTAPAIEAAPVAVVSEVLPLVLASIPTELQSLPRWVCWQYVEGRKIPFNARNHARASVTDPQTWSEYAQAVATYQAGGFAGIGIVLDGSARLAGVDIDGCVVDGVPSPEALALLASLDARYIEVSPSGKGLRAFGYADALTSGANGQINDLHTEFYTKGRYLTLTGHALQTGPLSELVGFADMAQKARDGKKAAREASKPAPATNTPAPAPQPHQVATKASDKRIQAYASAALDNAAQAVASAPEGQRNDALNSNALSLFRLPAVDPATAWDTLQDAAVSNGLERREVLATLGSARDAAATMPPREVPPSKAAPAQAPAVADTGGDGDTLGWSDPTPLPNDIPPVAPFDLELLPEALRGWVADIAERMQCPPDFTAVGAIAALSGLIGARAVVKPKQYDDWAVVPVLWGMIVGRPGVMKSPALSEVLKPVKRLEAAEREFHDAIMGEWELDAKLAEKQNKTNEKQAEKLAIKDPAKARELLRPADSTPAPTLKRYMVNDATVQKLAMMLTDNPWGLLVYRDEIHGLLASMDKEGQEGARGFYLTGYDGNQGHAVDRVTREDHYVPRVCLAMLGGIQPGKLQSYVRGATSGGESDDGLLQRFSMVVWPDINKEFQKVDRWPDTPAKQIAHDVFERLSKLQPLDENTPQEWHFTPEAQAIYWEWVEPFEREIRGDTLHPALVSHLSKYRKLVPALALIFAMIDTPDSGNLIDTPELLRALAWLEYLRSHAERVYAAATVPETSGARTLLARLQGGKLIDRDGVMMESFTAREVSQKHWTGLDNPEAVRKAANLLADYGWLDRETPPIGPTGGRPSPRYHLHPCLLSGGRV